MGKNARLQFILTYTVSDQQKHDAVAAVGAALADGALRVGEEHGLPLTRFPLAETAAAHDAVEAGTVGKVLLDVG
jgi:NADPH2:quinone reductase